jgi:hypothetical protein
MFREIDAILAQNRPYNSPRKAKVTLAFVGLLYKRKLSFEAGGSKSENQCNPLKIKLTGLRYGLKIA